MVTGTLVKTHFHLWYTYSAVHTSQLTRKNFCFSLFHSRCAFVCDVKKKIIKSWILKSITHTHTHVCCNNLWILSSRWPSTLGPRIPPKCPSAALMKTSTGSGAPWSCLTKRAWESEPPAAHLTWVRRRAAGFTHRFEVRACPSAVWHYSWSHACPFSFLLVHRDRMSSATTLSPFAGQPAMIFDSLWIYFSQIWQPSAVLLYKTASISSKFLFSLVSRLPL